MLKESFSPRPGVNAIPCPLGMDIELFALFITQPFGKLKPLHGFVNKSGREILQRALDRVKAILLELFFVFHAQIFYKICAQLKFLR